MQGLPGQADCGREGREGCMSAGGRLWLDMCQQMMWQEQIKMLVCLWETRSYKLEAVTDSLYI